MIIRWRQLSKTLGGTKMQTKTKQNILKATTLFMIVLPCFALQQAKATNTPISAASAAIETAPIEQQTHSETNDTAIISDESVNEGTEDTEIVNGVAKTNGSSSKKSMSQSTLRSKRSQSNIRTTTKKQAKSY